MTIRDDLRAFLDQAVKEVWPHEDGLPPVEVEVPNDPSHGDWASNFALKSARTLKKSPLDIAHTLTEHLRSCLKAREDSLGIAQIEVKAPGFINFTLAFSTVQKGLETILQEKETFGRCHQGQGLRVQIEFVSANPTGPLSVAHARQAAVGDCLARVMTLAGYQVTKEYYVNDEGNQIDLLGRSLQARALEACGQPVPIPEGGYEGAYIRDLAVAFMKERGLETLEDVQGVDVQEWSVYGVKELLRVIEKELADFGVTFDVWSYQSKIAAPEALEELLADFLDKGLVYEKEGALWFASTRFGDDKDRVVRKRDGAYTYFTPDIVYHQQKFVAGFQKVINIWGPDHHGYIPRLRAAVQALGQDPEALEVLIVQLATIYRNGRPVSMSTRKGQYIQLREVLDEVGRDAARFFFLMRQCRAHLDFDLDLAKKETPENPVYYIQYAHARIHSIFKKAQEEGVAFHGRFESELNEPEELLLAKKLLHFPTMIDHAAREREPFGLANYLLELAVLFHKFYDRHRVVSPDNPALTQSRLALSEAVRWVLRNGLHLTGVSAPERM